MFYNVIYFCDDKAEFSAAFKEQGSQGTFLKMINMKPVLLNIIVKTTTRFFLFLQDD